MTPSQSGRKTPRSSLDLDAAEVHGRATVEGTRRYADRFRHRFAPDFYRETPHHLALSSIGMGTYLGECDDAEDDRYTRTIEAGIASGLNVIDTAINYRCQRSERAVGRAVQRAIASGKASRDELFICTKGGYVPLEGAPPASRADYDTYLTTEYFDRSIMTREDLVAGGHCLTPAFLANQIERSLHNIDIDHIDVFYVHNPEQQFDTLDRAAFKSVIGKAFDELESHVSNGRIGAYGCAAWNGFRVDSSSRNHLSLAELVSIAEKVGGRSHHFRFVQLPVNLAMTEAIRLPTQEAGREHMSLLDLARDRGISVMASASLMQSQLTRNLPPAVTTLFPELTTDAQRAIAFVRSLPVTSALVGMRRKAHLDENIIAGKALIRA